MNTPHDDRSTWWNRGGLALLLLLLSPARAHVIEGVEDDFPLSYYPMFTKQRAKTTRIHHVIGRTSDGEDLLLPGRCFGAGGMNTVRRQIRRWAREKREEEVLDRAVDRLSSCFPDHERVVEVALVRSTYPLSEARNASPTPVGRVTYGAPRTLEVVR